MKPWFGRTSSSSPRHRADGTLPRHFAGSESGDRHRVERVQNSEVPCVRYLIGRIVKTYDYINRVVLTLPLSDLQGYEDTLHLSLLYITMILRVRRNFFEITTFPNKTYGPRVYLHHINLPTLSYFPLPFILLCIFIIKIPKILSYHIYQISLS